MNENQKRSEGDKKFEKFKSLLKNSKNRPTTKLAIEEKSNRMIGNISTQLSANVAIIERIIALCHATEIFDLARDAASVRR